MTDVKIKSFVIDNINSTDAEIEAGLGADATVFSVSVVPISSQKSRVIVAYNTEAA
jgi:hypothetical protein